MPRVERNVRPSSIKGADDFVSDHATRASAPAKFMVALATGNKMRSRPGSTPNGLLVSVPAYSRFPDGLVGVPAREQTVYCLILTREREP